MLFSGDCIYVRSDEGYLCMSRIDKMWTDRKYVIILFYVIEEITWASNTGSHNLTIFPETQVSTDTCFYWDFRSFNQAHIILWLIGHCFVHDIRLRFI